jgi:pimeloyl-ACP methyl ester carboxylesterase
MATFVLVPGAWLGAWVWEEVAGELRGRGHDAVPITLSGLDGREDVSDIGLGTHIDDVLAVVAEHPGSVLVGHSYSGVVVGSAADRAGDLVAHTVYVDANLPYDGEALTSPWSPRGREFVEELIADNGGRWPAPDPGDFAGHDLTDEQMQWLAAQAVGHPGRTIFEPVALSRPAVGTCIACLRPTGRLTAEVESLRGWHIDTLDTGHWPMVSAPADLATLLVDAAARTPDAVART